MSFKKVKVTLKFPKCFHLEKLLLAYVIVLLMPYNFYNHNIFIFLKRAVIFKVDKVIALYILIIKNSIMSKHAYLKWIKLLCLKKV